MLDLFRKRGLTSVVYGVIIVGMIAVFVINFRPNANQKSASLREACAATVKGVACQVNRRNCMRRHTPSSSLPSAQLRTGAGTHSHSWL